MRNVLKKNWRFWELQTGSGPEPLLTTTASLVMFLSKITNRKTDSSKYNLPVKENVKSQLETVKD